MLLTICNVCDFILLSTPRNLESSEGRKQLIETNSSRPLTHYLICESDRLRVAADSVNNSDLTIAFKVKQQISEFEWAEHDVEMPSEIEGRKHKIRVDGPVIFLIASDDQETWFANTFLFLEFLGSTLGTSDAIAELLKLTVMYVGQTEITDAYVRFDGHEKLNKVFSEVVDLRSNREVWIKLLSFQPPITNAISLPQIESPYRSDWLPGGGLFENLPADQLKNAIEGVLIKYFQPILNIQLKKNFPSDRHTSYRYFYQHNIRSLVVELHEEFNSYVTGNSTVPYTKIKLIEFALSADGAGIFLHDNATQDLDELVLKKKI
jgi:hypothetical protein